MSYTSESQQEKVRDELRDTSPIVVRFYKESCPACQMSKMPWKQFCSQFSQPSLRILEVEEQAIPPEVLANITAFPTYAKYNEDDSPRIVHSVGAITDASDIPKKLKLKKKH
jgi:Thioredoxin